jgi:isocitrate lyase
LFVFGRGQTAFTDNAWEARKIMEHLHMKTRTQQIEELNKEWTQPRWEGITRPYSAEDVVKLRGSVNPECTLAQLGAAKMWRLLHGEAKKATSTASAR